MQRIWFALLLVGCSSTTTPGGDGGSTADGSTGKDSPSSMGGPPMATSPMFCKEYCEYKKSKCGDSAPVDSCIKPCQENETFVAGAAGMQCIVQWTNFKNCLVDDVPMCNIMCSSEGMLAKSCITSACGMMCPSIWY